MVSCVNGPTPESWNGSDGAFPEARIKPSVLAAPGRAAREGRTIVRTQVWASYLRSPIWVMRPAKVRATVGQTTSCGQTCRLGDQANASTSQAGLHFGVFWEGRE